MPRILLPTLFCFFLVFSPANAIADDPCLNCHSSEAGFFDGESNLLVDTETWVVSVHAVSGFTCAVCHSGAEVFPHDATASEARCSNCHTDSMEAFEGSVHDENIHHYSSQSPFPEGDPCVMCHGVHDVLPSSDPNSSTAHQNIPNTCARCHGDVPIVQANQLSSAPFENYQQSVHGLRLSDPLSNPAVCTDCHDYHFVVRANQPDSHINPFNIPDTCGQCHSTESEQYLDSVHGAAFMQGVSASPSCTNCHGIHSIATVTGEGATEREQHLVRTTCPACHDSEALMSEYGVAPERVRTYDASYHGLANQRGSATVADCASCHGIHAIYPSTDGRSTVAPANLQETCGSCHPGASVEFSRNPVHFTTDGESTEDVIIITWVKRIYWTLIIVVLGGMLLHNFIIIFWHVRRKLREEKAKSGRTRFTTGQIIQHALLVLTFFVLVISGFMLAYPDAWWVQLLMRAGVSESIRRWTHRIAAIGMMAVSLYHLRWLLFTKYGRRELRRLAPRLRDVGHLFQNMRFHLGRSGKKPAFNKYDYAAKAEYWALVWGTIIMALTGLIMWFPVAATSWLPYWVVKVSEVIHLLEAWLATGAIVVFHFFYVIGHPDVYPVNLSMFHGKMDEETAREDHPNWVETEAEEDSDTDTGCE